MYKKILIMFLSMMIIVLFIGCEDKDHGQLSQKEKLEDFNYMYEVIKEAHPFLEVNKRVSDVDWLENKEQYMERVKSTTDDKSFINEIQYILLKLNNRHSHLVLDNDFFNLLRECDEDYGWFDFWEDPNVIKRYGAKTEPITETKDFTGNTKVILNDVVDGKIGYMHLPEMVVPESLIEKDLVIIEEYLKGMDNYEALVIDIRGNRGGNDLYWESIVSMIIDQDMERSGYVLFRSGEVVDKYLKSTAHEVSDINELIDLGLQDMPNEVRTDFNSYFQVNKIIESKRASNFNGKIYLLVDKNVFSSSESFAIFAKDSGFATLIGQVTRGDGGGVSPILFNLPNSGLIIRIPSNMYLTPSGECNVEFKTKPDYIVNDATIGNVGRDFSQDKCIQKVLELENLSKDQWFSRGDIEDINKKWFGSKWK